MGFLKPLTSSQRRRRKATTTAVATRAKAETVFSKPIDLNWPPPEQSTYEAIDKVEKQQKKGTNLHCVPLNLEATDGEFDSVGQIPSSGFKEVKQGTFKQH